MRLTPIEIRQHRFSYRLRGLDPAEVQAFLEAVVGDFEEVVRENAQLRRENEALSREVSTYRSREQAIQDTLTTAQGVVDELKKTALKEAEVLVGEAEVRAEKIMVEVEGERGALSHEIADLKQMRRRMSLDLRRTLEGYLNLLDPDESVVDDAAGTREPGGRRPFENHRAKSAAPSE